MTLTNQMHKYFNTRDICFCILHARTLQTVDCQPKTSIICYHSDNDIVHIHHNPHLCIPMSMYSSFEHLPGVQVYVLSTLPSVSTIIQLASLNNSLHVDTFLSTTYFTSGLC